MEEAALIVGDHDAPLRVATSTKDRSDRVRQDHTPPRNARREIVEAECCGQAQADLDRPLTQATGRRSVVEEVRRAVGVCAVG